MRGAALLLKGGGSTKPVPLWAVGTSVAGGVTRPFCLYKPIGRPWQLQYSGLDVPSSIKASFFTGCRNPDDDDGVIWAGLAAAPVAKTSWRVAAKSTDYGVSWSFIDLNAPGANDTGEVFGSRVASPGAGQVVAYWHGSTDTHMAYGGGSGLSQSTLPAQAFPGHAGQTSPDILFLPARLSPTAADVFVIFGQNLSFTARNAQISVDAGATWTIVASGLLDTGAGNISSHDAVGTFAYDGARGLFISGSPITSAPPSNPSAGLYGTLDLSAFTELTSNSYGPNAHQAQIAGVAVMKRGNYRLMVDGIVYASGDAGATWVAIGAKADVRRLRQFGGRLYTVSDDSIWSSGTGGRTWTAETLPALPDGAVINDIFGPQYPKLAA